MDDFWAAQLTARRIEEETGLSLADQAAMPLDEWARLAYGKTPAQAALEALQAQQQPPAQDATQTVPAEQPQAPQTPDFASMSLDQYAQYRQAAGIGQGRKENKGIFSAPGRQEYADAVRAHSGRTSLANSNVVEPPRLTGRHVRQGDRRDTRSAAERFSVPGNSFNI